MASLISAVTWIKRGTAARHPHKKEIDEEELKRVSAFSRIDVDVLKKEVEKAQKVLREAPDDDEDEDEDDAKSEEVEIVSEHDEEPASDGMDEDVEEAPETKVTNPNDLSEYKLDEYDDDSKPEAAGLFTNIGKLAYYEDDEKDPYVTLKEDDEDDEREALEVLPTDNLIVTARTEDDVSQLEIYIYDEEQEHLHARHDIMLPSFPLCIEWLDYPPASSSSSKPASETGNFIAVGTFEPEIEIWSLDTVEQMYPDTVLGRPDITAQHVPVSAGSGKKKKKKQKHRDATAAHHVDAVLSLSWNRSHRNLLASASADRTVKLWDLSRDPLSENGGAIRSFDVHKDKVQAVQWNSSEATVLLTGSYDRTVRMFDTRSPELCVGAMVDADVEALRWDPFEPHAFMVSLENGIIQNFDARSLPSDLTRPSPARWTLSAHDGAVSSMDINPHIPGCIVTGGTDKAVKIWNIVEEEGNRQISMVASRDLGIGKVFTTQWSPDDPLTIAAAGSKGGLQIWDAGANSGARAALGPKLHAMGKQLKGKEGGGIVTVQDDAEDDGSGWEDEE